MLRKIALAAVLVAVPVVASAQQPCTTDARRVVDELYRHMLERAPDAGSAGWVSKLQAGTTVRDIVRAIAVSPEHAQRFYNPGEGDVAHERAVATLYRHILGRQPDAAGLRAFTLTAMNSGLEAVVDSIRARPSTTRTLATGGVPGSGGIRYCGTSAASTSTARNREMRFPALDTNRDGVVSRTEWRGTSNAFRIRDWNGDGVLSGDEVRLGAYPPDDSLEARDFAMPSDDWFGYLDVDNNGTVTESEWDGTLDAFDRLDNNRDGRLSAAELGSVRPPTPFATVDSNRDGRVVMGEWPWSRRSFIRQDTNSDGVITRGEDRGGDDAAGR